MVSRSRKWQYAVLNVDTTTCTIVPETCLSTEDARALPAFSEDHDNDASPDATPYAHLLARLPRDHARFILYDLAYAVPRDAAAGGGADDEMVMRTSSRLVLITWCPDDAPVRERMLFASSKAGLVQSLENAPCGFGGALVQASDWDDMTSLVEMAREAVGVKGPDLTIVHANGVHEKQSGRTLCAKEE
ncbi:hypothetical protein CXG81DRAFT_24273 [Caulochytrium protostelioides]|uniref:ADF-H domain-containing protein n=1 Tax=Caulochytrium protostelioides TaxID=1555241 RepID=A0A4V1ITM9_9FUNG|nr:hypothetical protein CAUPRSCDRAFT_10720 [Caulochytrium protostelioides]RKP03066.1 hypothetical protein CXG81DRAFT_24273 [Caulochytrium protostelioides]|eukprot:RKP03066.1 hypothetical protein CXG81DRAFT_24273 [Caulochytrium protostelioides]